MHLLGIGTEIEVSGHVAVVTAITSMKNTTPFRNPVVKAKIKETGRKVSILGVDIEKVL
jgi:hypothetical protein